MASDDDSPDELEASNSLDHALLESLFYDEMALMDGSAKSDTSSLYTTSSQQDPSVAAEKALLRDFGVTNSPGLPTLMAAQATPKTASPAVQLPTVPFIPPPARPESSSQEQIRRNQLLSSTRGGIRHSVVSVPPAAAAVVANPLSAAAPVASMAATTSAPIVPSAPAAPMISSAPPPVPPKPVVAATTKSSSAPPPPPPQATTDPDKHQKMVDQFATLAGRLGITLPPQVLDKLTQQKAATSNNEKFSQQLQSTAAEAIAAVSSNPLKRPFPTATTANTANTSTTAPYSKRRKKPRLVDCERRLSELQAENALLKRHLDNISNQSQKLEQERVLAETNMKRMLQNQSTSSQELSRVVQHFTEMYSDYGRKRHEELNFHLEQLQRLANPTNFTKMGLWTLGGQSRTDRGNPIAGILQKELGITPQQGKKILDQRQKIQQVCSNLKECLALLGKLKAVCEQKTKLFHDRMSYCREILTPRQVVKLVVWIDENSQTLGSVCPGWGSEQFQASSKKDTSENTSHPKESS